MKHLLTFLFLSLTTMTWAQNADLERIMNDVAALDETYQVTNEVWWGKHPTSFTFQRAEQQIEKVDKLRPLLAELVELSDSELDEQEVINKAIKVLQLRDEISRVDFKTYLIPFNAEGGFFNSPSFFLPYLPFETKADYEAYFTWLVTFSDYLDYNQALMQQGIEEGIQSPNVIVENILDLLETWSGDDPTQHPFYAPLSAEEAGVVDRELRQRGERLIAEEVIPAYQELTRFIREAYLPQAPEEVGVAAIQNGRAYYENRVRHFTTLELTPDSVFNVGQSEVARIRQSMDQIIEELDFEGDFAAFLDFLRTDPQFYAKTGQELLNRAAWLSKKAEGQLPRLFSTLYSLPFTVEPVPDDIAPKYTGGRYVGGNREQNTPGIYWVNTYNLKSRTLYTLPALSLHEAVPGHHLQITIASELEGLPDFRKNYYISAFGEGWGLYSEYLGEEMGMYQTPYDLFGRYTYEMWRACRLVVDVGLHYKGWTRQQAIDFMASNTALSLHEVTTEIDRYIGWPGQALSYKIGELTIKNLRTQATESLGSDFDIQQFHEIILKNGSVPLPILVDQVTNYIAAKKGEQ